MNLTAQEVVDIIKRRRDEWQRILDNPYANSTMNDVTKRDELDDLLESIRYYDSEKGVKNVATNSIDTSGYWDSR